MIKRTTSMLAVIAVLLLAACQKEISSEYPINFPPPPPPPPPPAAVQGSFTAKIDGVSWSANVNGATRQGGVLVIYGAGTDKKSMLLRVADSAVYSYSLPTSTQSNAGVYTDSALSPIASFATNQWAVAGNYGNLNVTAIDTVKKTMSGTFSMKVFRQLDNLQRNITEGKFTNIPYTTEPPAPSSTDSFRVKVGGVAFTYNLLTAFKGFGRISVSAAQGVAPAVGVSFPDNTTPGNYPFDLFTYIGQYNPSATVFLGADTGSVTILEHNTVTKRIRGNFNFLANTVITNLPPNVQITEGYFSVKYN